MRLILSAVAVCAIALPALAQPASVTVPLKGAKGEDMGAVTLTEAPKGVLVKVEAKGLTPGWHGLHFHEKGDCGTPDFKSAGGHVHGAGTVVHGLLKDGANEAGDLPNLWVGADGVGKAEVFSPWTSMKGAGGRQALQDKDGSAVVIHAKADDHMSQPIGGAGDRVACGVIKGGDHAGHAGH
ncbi:superoxide dismutase family protein [Caulobacter sp. SLTY]|uniref:superoxide dismutase family protein n=1 Tax=Caulobacter sp. SLTY TaxID=2683262 RepID=UPI001411DA5C|nr:superoxide dismutase family protein [Caulobacter sp. SLTY]NBB15848.1 superoxide dismutase family protein [Caulobacter sp. SLTY]